MTIFITGKVITPHPTHLQKRDPQNVKVASSSSSSHMTRSHATSTTSNVATSSTVAPPTVHDHNYVGDPGPSTSSAAQRNSRRVLSRHQRNADELDISLEPLENSMLISATTRLRRGMPTSTTAAPANSYQREESQPTVVTVRRGRSRFSQENSQTEPSADEQLPEDEEGGVSDMGTGGSTESSVSEDASDSEDNQPLTSYVPKSKNSRNSRRKRRRSDDSFIADEDDDDEKYASTRRHTTRKPKESDEGKDRTRGRRNQRGSRNQKRPRYNELSDDEEFVNTNSRGRKSRKEPTTVGSSAVNDDLDASTMDSDDDQLVSVSSRGRVRKITAKARGIFKE